MISCPRGGKEGRLFSTPLPHNRHVPLPLSEKGPRERRPPLHGRREGKGRLMHLRLFLLATARFPCFSIFLVFWPVCLSNLLS